MKNGKNSSQGSADDWDKPQWQNIVADFLETGCYLNREQRDFILNELKMEAGLMEHIDVHPAFTINRKLVCVLDIPSVEECWFYFPHRARIEKHLFKTPGEKKNGL